MSSDLTCWPLAPKSTNFSGDVFDAWGYGGVVFLALPPILTLAIIGVYCEEVYYIMQKTNSKDLRNSLLWILGTYPAIMVIGTIAVFMPRSLMYLTFLYNMYVAFATYKYYYLMIVFCGGTLPFVEKSKHREVGLNVIPCCCLSCLPTVHNSPRITLNAKWMIFQNVILTPFYGALACLLKSDFSLYSTTGVSPSVYISAFNGIATLMCMYGFNLIQKFAKTIEGMEQKHAIRGKTACFQLIMIVTGLEGIFFNILATLGVFPCQKPFDFNSNRKAYNNYAVIMQTFFLALMARYFYRRKADIQRQHTLHDDLSIGSAVCPKAYQDEVTPTFDEIPVSYNGVKSSRDEEDHHHHHLHEHHHDHHHQQHNFEHNSSGSTSA